MLANKDRKLKPQRTYNLLINKAKIDPLLKTSTLENIKINTLSLNDAKLIPASLHLLLLANSCDKKRSSGVLAWRRESNSTEGN